jgi:hypothetical protein
VPLDRREGNETIAGDQKTHPVEITHDLVFCPYYIATSTINKQRKVLPNSNELMYHHDELGK